MPGVGAPLHWISVRSGNVDSLSSFLADNNVELHDLIFAHAELHLVRVIPGDHCLVDEYIHAGVVAIDEAVRIPIVKPFNRLDHSFFFVAP